ncbi:Type 1 glutamine amidotransferase-like domain-containing protein [Brevibacterium atlanticum]|uniref:Type 1 glutamine amidotransferase-like domain-containing protein n=1 Tax=Brevibacterium atlanticum TaxID=2697563 RepID=UPI001D181BE4|nr:peptidase E [Brevibacterium atlanticum]
MTANADFRGTIVALGGGGFSMSENGDSAIDDALLQMAQDRRQAQSRSQVPPRRGSSSDLPHVCFVPTASGDSRDYIARFEAAFAGRAQTHVLSLFGHSPWEYQDPAMLEGMDLVYVGGGSTANLLALWRRHGVDEIMREAAAGGTILAGISAGANCWFEASSTDSFGPLAPLDDGLGFLRGSVCPHFRGEPGREESFLGWIADGSLPGPGIAIDDHAAVVWVDGEATSVMVESEGAAAYLVDDDGSQSAPMTGRIARERN